MTTPTHRHSQLNNLSPTLHQNHGENHGDSFLIEQGNHGDRFLIEQVHIKQPVPMIMIAYSHDSLTRDYKIKVINISTNL